MTTIKIDRLIEAKRRFEAASVALRSAESEWWEARREVEQAIDESPYGVAIRKSE